MYINGDGTYNFDYSYFYGYDGEGNIVEVYNQAGSLPYGLYSYSAYGSAEKYEGDDVLDGGYKGYDKGPFGYKTGVRHYDPETGRFLSPDPFKGYLTDPPSQNPYMYTRGNPIKYFDPSGYDYLKFDGKCLYWYDDHHQIRMQFPVYSGSKGDNSRDKIPEGTYYINPKNIEVIRILHKKYPKKITIEAYGPFRVWLRQGFFKEKLYTKFNIGRGEFFLHGGYFPGTAGCIEIKDYSKEQKLTTLFFKELLKYGKKIKLEVQYPYKPPVYILHYYK